MLHLLLLHRARHWSSSAPNMGSLPKFLILSHPCSSWDMYSARLCGDPEASCWVADLYTPLPWSCILSSTSGKHWPETLKRCSSRGFSAASSPVLPWSTRGRPRRHLVHRETRHGDELFSASAFLGPVMGPLIAVFIVESDLSWRWVFLGHDDICGIQHCAHHLWIAGNVCTSFCCQRGSCAAQRRARSIGPPTGA
ncbi:unnamed protein product [Mycena citricolor]|uniref:Uncharacterized protein n=1 Tax=Mycena citricolor TaxID=2018698 RepID=A0AAD2HA95_9AGAR|nr:unnamed protein product [Mycena citricolor]